MTVYLAVNINSDCEFDAIAFNSYNEMKEFCDIMDDYQPFETDLHTVDSALEIFGIGR